MSATNAATQLRTEEGRPEKLSGAREQAWVLGLDGGGTHTRLALASREGEVVGPYFAAGASPADEPAWRSVLGGLLSKVDPAAFRLDHATLGLAGFGDTPAISSELVKFVTPLLPGPVSCENDVAIAFYGAFLGAPGVLVLAGTGSMGWGQTAAGVQARVGGLGPELGDGGSGYWVGHRAIRALGRSLDGLAPADEFTDALASSLALRTTRELIDWFRSGNSRARVASVAREVAELAENDVLRAQRILDEAARELASHARVVKARLKLPRGTPVSLAGGLFKSRYLLTASLRNLAGEFTPTKPMASPLGGALLSAAGAAGWPRSEAWLTTIEARLSAGKS